MRGIKFWREKVGEEVLIQWKWLLGEKLFRGDGLMDTLTTLDPFVEVLEKFTTNG